MLNYLQGCQRSTPIGMLPDIINHNNEAIDKEFQWIYDASLNRLTKSVYAPSGSVKSHFGEFVNLSTEYLTVKNIDSLKATITKAVEDIIFDTAAESHKVLHDRFSEIAIEELYKDDYAHDAASIIYSQDETVKDAIDKVKDSSATKVEFEHEGIKYTQDDIISLIEWKNSLTVETLTITSGGVEKVYNILCAPTSAEEKVEKANRALNVALGDDPNEDKDEVITYSDSQLSAALDKINEALGDN